MTTILRGARPDDAAVCGAICFEAFKAIAENHNFPPDFGSVDEPIGLLAHVFDRDDIYCVVAETDGKVVGSNALWENGDVAGVGPVTVDPNVQSASIGKQLMKDVMRRANDRGFARVRLVQAAFNNLSMALYTKLGFDVREPLSVMHGEALNVEMPGLHVRSATTQDEDACNELCRNVHGHFRKGELADSIAQGTAVLVERDDRITGYSTVLGFWGHTIGETNEDIKALVGGVEEYAGPGFLLPSRNADLLRWCLDRGLRIRQPMTLMSYGPYNEPSGAFMPSILF